MIKERDDKGRIIATEEEGRETKKPGQKKKPRTPRKEYNNRWGVPLDVEIK